MLNLAHRGFKGSYPENTMLAYRKAIEVGADGVEFDVHLTKDGELVIIHDENLIRTCGVDILVKDLSLAELKKYDAANGYEQYHEEIPTLREYFAYAKDLDIVTNIEIKNGLFFYEGIEKKLYDLIKEYSMEEKVIISSFNHQSILRMKDIDDSLKLAFLEESIIADPISYLKENSIKIYHPIAQTIDKALLDKFHEEGITVNAWTSDKIPYDFKELNDIGFDAIISDYPDRFVKELR
ncbi:glycerophosphodiester phosphodiesterase [Anaerococcus tetradius]|uniref:Glycerophosphodiester phosphodiesterase family protein n=1 Tax=Anaerococcus tetradius TaxID=33036 RepID=A0A133K8C2_9FIRM|nr:glycerophosphodiester phosphodiesterase [Anaerococcus tetradius]KWZ75793.1 glycerophosphodiester phosphodiesterase family protein [Anaerococcus tetradius]